MYDKILFGYATFIDCCAREELSIYDIDDFCNIWQESNTKRSLCECIGLPFDDFKELGNDNVNIYKKLSEHMLKIKAYYR